MKTGEPVESLSLSDLMKTGEPVESLSLSDLMKTGEPVESLSLKIFSPVYEKIPDYIWKNRMRNLHSLGQGCSDKSGQIQATRAT